MKIRRGEFVRGVEGTEICIPCIIHGIFQYADGYCAEPQAVIEMDDGTVTTAPVDSIRFTEPLKSVDSGLLYCLKQIMNSLPTNRDWLDPDIERMAQSFIDEAEGGE